ncbi:IS3 family transposase [Thiomicrorhabdus indica]|uniref:IS3 family transposase n=1 Tax=Thiomicrorhabdus indica TaxID=2267253 RepID=UPI002AA90407|nr:IS3 family transposase [Thiomicrorhabdus indica]
MSSNTKRTQRDYSLAFKLSVVDQVEKGEMTYKQAQAHYGIQGRSTVLVWLRKHGKLNWSDANAINRHLRGIIMPTTKAEQTPEQRIKELEQELAEEKLKAQFFEGVVKVMKEDFGVSLNKKAVSRVIDQKQIQGLNISNACRFLQISRQAYYQGLQRQRLKEKQYRMILDFVQAIRISQPRIGTRKLHNLLLAKAQEGLKIGRDKLFDLLRWQRLLVPNKRAYHKTTHSHHRFYKHPNLIKEQGQRRLAKAPEKLWVADITYLPVQHGQAYLSLVTDACSRKIVGYHVHDTLHAQPVLQALKNAVKNRLGKGALIHHSDRGIQYCSKPYQVFHEKHGIICSMTDGYDCYQNALAERVNGILKNEFLLTKPKDVDQARQMVKESIEIYNTQRPHLALKYKTPDEVHRAFFT